MSTSVPFFVGHEFGHEFMRFFVYRIEQNPYISVYHSATPLNQQILSIGFEPMF